MSASTEPIIVIGAGVIGLSCATLLQYQYPKATITIIAAEFPNTTTPSADYASAWAGAHYRPIPQSTPQLRDEAQLAFHTADIMKKIARDSPEAGVAVMQGIEYLESPTEGALSLRTGDVYAGRGDRFRILEKSELPQGVQWGCEYQTYAVNVQIYCEWLLDRFVARGGSVLQRRISDATQVFDFGQGNGRGSVRTVVNCSGRNFDRDPKIKIIRGQTVLVKQQYHHTITRQNRDGSWTFLIPRPRGGGTIVGGTKEIGDHHEKARPETRSKLLQQCVEVFPDFVESIEEFEVVKDNVGRRPWREGGVRVEIESIDGDRRLVHSYGAGGRGYELSWGVAERVVELIRRSSRVTARL
ncbi:uncharacterized protein A1O9_04798 [Exophiala aquamarina CBS 119918]|uniref:FAD dependent oxidoreductase domain-containing protein n=1 Tax=Exophiala aquamarina CBS 119918 TaxID=1182545 RepID=A0A072PWI5_9EURO|nr:uncharacterized protein A1O9_04798 [Exophiala aquamarina CBS 119918]KEF59950.1 hypothetical protein A1O9_04798 [Exophiala aquamarina CBS 119918]